MKKKKKKKVGSRRKWDGSIQRNSGRMEVCSKRVGFNKRERKRNRSLRKRSGGDGKTSLPQKY